MKYSIIAISILLFKCHITYGQAYEDIDKYVQSLHIDDSATIETTVKAVTKPFKTDTQKIRALYSWLAKNIDYDYVGYKSDYWDHYKSYEDLIKDTFKFRKGVCSGYSHLFKRMLEKCNIESEVINGYARFDLSTIFLNETNHAWNRVKIDNKWELLDVTWAYDTTTTNVDDFYFLTEPEIFILNHYPADYKYSHLEEYFSLNQFMDFPIYNKYYYTLGFDLDKPKKGLFIPTDDTLKINLKSNPEYVLIPKWYDLKSTEWINVKNREYNRTENWIKLYVPRKSRLILKIDILEQSDGFMHIYDDVIIYTVDNTKDGSIH